MKTPTNHPKSFQIFEHLKNLKQISKNIFEIPKEKNMKVAGRLFISENLLKSVDKDTLEQVKNVACLDGICGYSMAMPDIHKGYGFTIGGVAGFDVEKGIITPGGIGFDINCGIRVIQTNLTKDEVLPNIDKLLSQILKVINVGIDNKNTNKSKSSQITLENNNIELNKILENGVNWAKQNGYANNNDIEFCEENGCLENGNAKNVSQKAKGRGRNQIGTLGSGNHFIEVQVVDKIYDKETAKTFGIDKVEQVLVMIHTGSRGLGHQVATDYIEKIVNTYPEIIAKLPEKNLAYAPIQSQIGQDYLSAMRCSANFGWVNRQVISHFVKESFYNLFGEETELNLIYDISHNIAKFETHKINGVKKELCVYRKGATSALPPNHTKLPQKYKKTGQPIFLPGSCGTNSYILAGTQKAMDETLGSCAHGAGRKISRQKASKEFDGNKIIKELKNQDISIKGLNVNKIAQEGPKAYKDVSDVVKILSDEGIGKMVVKLKPLGVIKG